MDSRKDIIKGAIKICERKGIKTKTMKNLIPYYGLDCKKSNALIAIQNNN